MKICWDNLEKLRYNKSKKGWYDKYWNFYIYKESCQNCGKPFLAQKKNKGNFCDNFCAKNGENHPLYGKKRPEHSIRMSGENHPFYGKKRPEHSVKMSGEGNPKYWLGKKNLKHSKRMMGDNNPTKRSKVRKKMSENHADISRQNNPNWKGGISCEPYCDAWADKEYKESIKERDNNKCQNPDCWGTSKRLTIHHIDYVKKHCDPWNLITLCRSCNARANHNREYWQSYYIKIRQKEI